MADRVFVNRERVPLRTLLDERWKGALSRTVRLLRSIAREVRAAPSRLAHSARKSRAESALRGAERLQSIVFVCYGNICRSAYASVRLGKLLNARAGSVVVRSAGLRGPNGRPSPSEAIAAARRRGLDLDPHRSSVFDRQLHRADAIFVMEDWQEREIAAMFAQEPQAPIILALGDLDPEPFSHRMIRDPYGHPAAVFDDCFERIDRCVGRLADMIGSE